MRERRFLLIIALGLVPALAAAAAPVAGRWQGQADLNGVVQPLVVDLAREAQGRWVGSVTLPGRRVKGAPLAALAVDARGLRADLAAAFLAPGEPTPTLSLRWRGAGAASGTLTVGGVEAPVTLRRSGDAQVDRPPANTPIDDALAGVWTGRYELGGYPRDVTLTLRRGAAGLGEGLLLIVGRRRTELALDTVRQRGAFVEFGAGAGGLAIEGRHDAGAIEGVFMQGPFEAPLVLRRTEPAR